MYPYLKELTLDEALKVIFNEDLVFFSKNLQRAAPISISASEEFITKQYKEEGDVLSITALDYATHILGQTQPPEGYGYAAYSVDTNSRYSQLPYLSYSTGQWQHGVQELFSAADDVNWHLFCFLLTDLARVEAQTDTEKTEINAVPTQPVTDWEAKCKELEAIIDECKSIIYGQAKRLEHLETENQDLKEKSLGILGHVASNHIADQKMLNDRIAELEAVIEKQRIDINNYCRAADKATEQSGEFWQLLLRTQELNQQYQIALTRLL